MVLLLSTVSVLNSTLCFFAGLDSPHNPMETSIACVVDSVVIVQLFWAVDTYADEDVIVVQGSTPVVE